MRTWAGRRPRLPPDPWLTSTAAPLRDGTYQADSRRPSSSAIRTSSWGMPSADSWISQRGACVIRLAPTNGITTANATTAAPASQPAPWAARQPRPVRRGDGGEAGRHEQEPAERGADAGDVAPVEPRVDDVQAVRGDAEADREQPDDEAQPDARRPRHVRLGERPGGRHGEDREHAGHRGVGAREGEVEQVQGEEGEPGEQERALEAGDPLPQAGARLPQAGAGDEGRGHAASVPRARVPRRPWRPVSAMGAGSQAAGAGSRPV